MRVTLLLFALGLGGCRVRATPPVDTSEPAGCLDASLDGTETDVDCGGACAPCGDGLRCALPTDCESAVCGEDGLCLAPTCDDGVRNGLEASEDCGGSECDRCDDGETCLGAPDCASRVCDDGTCAAPSCGDGVHNGAETDTDCGSACPDCGDGRSCDTPDDCASATCLGGTCAAPTCLDGVRDGTETGTDCGGDCPTCPPGQGCVERDDCASGVCQHGACQPPRCDDSVINGAETDTDCGGDCPPCGQQLLCDGPDDCASGVCSTLGRCVPDACDDEQTNGGESGPDCGGPDCPACVPGVGCAQDRDCTSLLCIGTTCAAPSCTDAVRNQGESDADCGGTTACRRCQPEERCDRGADCATGSCDTSAHACLAATCDDDVVNGGETDEDCGGPGCDPCVPTQTCATDGDCDSGRCDLLVCAPPDCDDDVQNGGETDVDCGGGTTCDRCRDYAACADAADCASAVCVDGRCHVPACDDDARNGDEADTDCGGPTGCDRCDDGARCDTHDDCASGVCDGTCQIPSCGDETRNGLESGTDCGGTSLCDRCGSGEGCEQPVDCESLSCDFRAGECLEPTCGDGIANGDETDTDCGGPTTCPRCQPQQACDDDDDCASGVCDGAFGECLSPTCEDDVTNGLETDEDCGGQTTCDRCLAGDLCLVAADCATNNCAGSPLRCVTASCTDGIENSGETDVDCGGPTCGRCTATRQCATHTDCLSGYCDNATCVARPSCKSLLASVPGTGSGVYQLDADGPTGAAPFQAYCDMVTSPGGWTLLMKATSGTSTLGYSSPYWETTATVNATSLSPNASASQGTDAKFEAFNQVPGDELRLVWLDPVDTFSYPSLAGRTALALFQGSGTLADPDDGTEILVVGNESVGCHGSALVSAPGYLASKMRHGKGRQFYGFNASTPGSGGGLRFRWGFGSNDETDSAYSCKQTIGCIDTSLLWTQHNDCSNNCLCYGTAYTPSSTAANLWVR